MCKSLTGFQVKVLESCYRHHYGAVGIVGPSAEILSSLESRESYSVILIDRRTMPDEWKYSEFKNKLHTFVLSIPEEVTMLENLLIDLMTSQWWNHMASFFIIDNPKLWGQNCSKADVILLYAWISNILNAKLICYHESQGLLIYSYNPYTDQAPIPWRQEKSRMIDGHLWTLFVRSYHQDSQIFCKNLNFDQTKDLGGYEIQISAIVPEIIEHPFLKLDFEKLIDPTHVITQYVFRAINSTKKLIAVESEEKLFTHITYGSIDISLNKFVSNEYIAYNALYPYLRSEEGFVVQHRGNLSQIEKLLRVIDRFSRYGVVIVCFITFVFFKFLLQQSITSAILTIVRLICNAGIPNPPNIVATRIYLTGLFIFVMTLQGIYQGKLASLLTKPVALPNAKTFDDLENFHYTIYGDESMLLLLKARNYSGPVVPVKHSCVEYVLRDDSAACFMKRDQLVNSAYMNDLHLSDMLEGNDFMFIVRDDWPPQERFNLLLSRLFESNIIERVYSEDYKLFLRKQKFYEEEKANQSPTVIALKDVAFAFAMLGIGLTGATVVFFIELWKGRE